MENTTIKALLKRAAIIVMAINIAMDFNLKATNYYYDSKSCSQGGTDKQKLVKLDQKSLAEHKFFEIKKTLKKNLYGYLNNTLNDTLYDIARRIHEENGNNKE